MALIDKRSGEFRWKWRDELGHQRDPTMLENGHILIFDNGWHSLQAPSPRLNRVFRAYRYGPDFPGFQGKDLNPERYAWLSHLYTA